MPASRPLAPETLIVSAGRDPAAHHGAVNTPVYRASTIVFRDAEHWKAEQAAKKAGVRGVYYGRLGTPTSHGLEDALTALEAAEATFLFPSGLAAIYHALAAFAAPGKRFLLAANCYEPSKRAAQTIAAGAGMVVELFDPMDLAGLDARLSEDVALVLIEAPGSNSFEVCDVDAIAVAAKAVGAVVAMDNTWATPLLFKPLAHGVDLSIQALTKYVSGHSDLLGGSVSVNACALPKMKLQFEASGAVLSGDECYSAAKGLRTMALRLRQHEASAMAVADWFATRPEAMVIRHPARPDAPGHAYWKAAFAGASGLFSVDFLDWGWAETRRFLDALTLFGVGASWGGFESLVLPCGNIEGNPDAEGRRFARIRFNIGLEDVGDLIADLAQALDAVQREVVGG